MADQVVRADFSFQKKDENGRNMHFIPFAVTNETTGETHYILTDANGEYWSQSKGVDTDSGRWTPHSFNTNANDEILMEYDEGGNHAGEVIPEEVIASLEKRCGTWFGLSQDVLTGGNTWADPDDTLRALPYGWYTIREMRCEANRDKTLVDDRFMVYRNDMVIDFGTIDNEPVALATKAKDAESGTQYGRAAEDTEIIDEVSYHGLDTAKTYLLYGELHYVKENDDGVRIDDGAVMSGGKMVTSAKLLHPAARDGETEVSFVFDASALKGGNVVVFETLYERTDTTITTLEKSESDRPLPPCRPRGIPVRPEIVSMRSKSSFGGNL